MSRFFRAAQSDSDDSSSDTDETTESTDSEDAPPQKTGAKPAGRWMDSDSDSDTGKRVAKSEKDRRMDEVREIVKVVNNHAKIGDWNQIVSDWDKLSKQLIKSARFLEEKNMPKFYIKMLVTLEDLVQSTSAASKTKPLSKVVAKSFNRMQQNLKKHNKTYEAQITLCREKPAAFEEDEAEASSAEESDSDSEPKKPVARPGVTAGQSKWLKKPGAESSDSSASEDTSDSDDSDLSDDGEDWQEGVKKSGASYWLAKKEDVPAEKVDKPTDKVAKVKKVEVSKTEVKKEIDWTPDYIKTKLRELLAARGRKGTDRNAQIAQLKDLADHSIEPTLKIDVLISLIASLFDSASTLATHMPSALWRSCHDYVSDVIVILNAMPDMKGQLAKAQVALELADQEETMEQRVFANLASYIGRLHDELIRAWQFLELATQDYIVRLQDDLYLLALAERTRILLNKVDAPRHAASVALLILEHLYYKKQQPVVPDALHATPIEKPADTDAITAALPEAAVVASVTEDIAPKGAINAESAAALSARVHDLGVQVYQHGDERAKARAILCEVFHHSVQDRFYEARDMLLMSHLQDSIQNHDIPTQVLFNRTMTQLGLCAFRHGLINEAHSCLTEISGSGKVRELLAQGINLGRYGERNPEQEKIERRRSTPPHMHINLDLLEFVHLTCAMLLEVPNMAYDQFDLRRRVISRPFRKLLDYYDRQIFIGPPENTRDNIMSASRSLARGEWQVCGDAIMKLPAWKLIPDADAVREMLARKIKEEGLRTYLFAYSTYYDTFSQEKLAEMFALDANTIHAIVSKMMINEELHASWDQPTSCIVMRKVEPSRLQSLALQCAEKVASFVETNERLVDARNGVKRDERRDDRGFLDRDRYIDKRRFFKDGATRNQQFGAGLKTQQGSQARSGMWNERQETRGSRAQGYRGVQTQRR
eukprot:TRINITY_DN12778_c0_g1_i1.p1 TRINITY_DN12778_c0_g1~~TRINITY_DN12778_c0_g1_i1.p1  ORF type:complete len:938 (+),score=232.07 TRINITY_DN12778_c0_g1_i1:65-2878(+)